MTTSYRNVNIGIISVRRSRKKRFKLMTTLELDKKFDDNEEDV